MIGSMLRGLTLLLFLALFVVAACGGDDGDSGGPGPGSGTPDGAGTPDSDQADAIATLLAEAAATLGPEGTATPGPERSPDVAAREDLAARLDTSVDDIEVLSVTEMEFPDSCLGLGQAGEVCAEVITPGFEVVLKVGSTEFTYRTNENGTHVRFADVSIGD